MKRTPLNGSIMWFGFPVALVHDASGGQSWDATGEFNISVILGVTSVEQKRGLAGVHFLERLAVDSGNAIPRPQPGSLCGTSGLDIFDARGAGTPVLLQVDAGAKI